MREIFSLVQRQIKIDVSEYKLTTVSRQRQMKVHKMGTLENYVHHLRSHPEAITKLCEENKLVGIPFRIWVPGCSTGEEAYSLAISLLEFSAGQLQFQIFATDISEKAIKLAPAGLYTDQQIRGLSEERLNCYFDKVKEGYKAKRIIRDYCIFSKHDMKSDPPPVEMF